MLQPSRLDLAFEKDKRRQQEIRLRPPADIIYKSVFDCVSIRRDEIVLDKEFAIDVRIKLPSGLVLLGQEKFLSSKYAKYSSVTIEYYQNQYTKEEGDWFKIGVQFYFVGYEDGLSFYPYVILNWPNVVLATEAGLINWKHNENKDGRARASFAYCRMDEFPESCIIAGKF